MAADTLETKLPFNDDVAEKELEQSTVRDAASSNSAFDLLASEHTDSVIEAKMRLVNNVRT
jgi:hypothetical protein